MSRIFRGIFIVWTVLRFGLDELVADPRFHAAEVRGSNMPHLRSIIQERVATQPSDYWLQRLVQITGPANEAHRSHAEAVAVERLLGRRDEVRVIGKPQIIVGAEIEHLAPASDFDVGSLLR